MSDRKKGELIELFKKNSEASGQAQSQTVTITGNANQVAGGDIHNHVNKKSVVKNVTKRGGGEFISSAQAKKLQDIVKKCADRDIAKGTETGKAFAKWHTKLKNYFNVPSYLEIPSHLGADAISWMSQQAAMTRPALRRTANQSWRNELYAAIYAKGGELGMSKGDIYHFVTERTGKNIISLTKLGEQDLKAVYTAIMGKKSK
jgi:hypothetical protein